ncbi:MAG TPA: helix-turn-helix transcriptional regulator [Ramlibacter sp.]|nr:helix-turn-helix transcriptional regulator [Ramlibacter sp.]
MDTAIIHCGDARQLGRSLHRWRALRRIKQQHAAELLGVSQATISRWENGQLAPDADEQVRLRALMQARLDSAADRELARLVSLSSAPMHLVCDLTHRLLALSPLREQQCSVPRNLLIGTSLWRYASAEIVAAEEQLAALGWYGPSPPALEIVTGANHFTEVAIIPSRFRWVRFQLSDGSFARLVETLELAPGFE